MIIMLLLAAFIGERGIFIAVVPLVCDSVSLQQFTVYIVGA